MRRTWLDDTLAALNRAIGVQVVGMRPPKLAWWQPEWFDAAIETCVDTHNAEPLAIHLRQHRESWLTLPMEFELTWETDAPAPHPIGRTGGMHVRSLADAFDLRDDPDWQAPEYPPEPGLACLVDIDSYHGNGNWTICRVDAASQSLVMHHMDGHTWHHLDVDPLTYYKLGFECLWWPGWQLLLEQQTHDPANFEQTTVAPMSSLLSRWFPNEEKNLLLQVISAWRARHTITGPHRT